MSLSTGVYFTSTTVYMSLSTGVYFTSTTADRNDWESFFWEYRVQLADHHSATTSLPPAECTAVCHPAMQPHFLGAAALRCARLSSNGSKALPDITIAMQYMTRHKWRSCNKFGSRILFFFRARVGSLTQSIGATRIYQYY